MDAQHFVKSTITTTKLENLNFHAVQDITVLDLFMSVKCDFEMVFMTHGLQKDNIIIELGNAFVLKA